MGNFSLKGMEGYFLLTISLVIVCDNQRLRGCDTQTDGLTMCRHCDYRQITKHDPAPGKTCLSFRMKLNTKCFNRSAKLPFGLRLKDFEMAMQDVYDFFYDVNLGLIKRGLQRLDDMLQPAIMSGFYRTCSQQAWQNIPGA